MFEPTLNLFSRYVSTAGSKRRYHSSRVSAWMSTEETVVFFVQCFYTDVAKASISNFRRVGTAFSGELPQARTVLLFGSYCGQIFPRRNLLSRRRKWYQVCTSYRLLCVIQPRPQGFSLKKWVGRAPPNFYGKGPGDEVVRDRQWNELPAKFKITWRHSNRPIRWRP